MGQSSLTNSLRCVGVGIHAVCREGGGGLTVAKGEHAAISPASSRSNHFLHEEVAWSLLAKQCQRFLVQCPGFLVVCVGAARSRSPWQGRKKESLLHQCVCGFMPTCSSYGFILPINPLFGVGSI